MLFVHDFLTAYRLIFGWLPRLHKSEGNVQHAMLEQHLCYSQAILCIFNETTNIFHSGRCECIRSPVCFVAILPIIENTPNIYNNMASSRKEWCTREHDKDNFFSFNGDKKIQTYHGYLDHQAEYVDEPEPCSTANICGQSVSLSFQSIDATPLPLVGDVSA